MMFAMFGPGVPDPLAAMLITRVLIAPTVVVTALETPEASVCVDEAVIGAAAVALNTAVLETVTLTAIVVMTIPELLVYRVIDCVPLENFAL